MLPASEKREELPVRRKLLFKEFQDNPQRLHLSLEIKIIDDQVAECDQQIRLVRSTALPGKSNTLSATPILISRPVLSAKL
jgi:hypothetical protein